MNTEKLEKAVAMATSAHARQWRDGESALPYISHPMDVMNRLRYVGGVTDADLLAAGVLHDVLEETTLSAEEIEAELGERVRDLVQSVTRREPSEEETAGLTKQEIWDLRSSILLAEIAEMDAESHLIKLADRASNMQAALVTRPLPKLKRYQSQTTKMLKLIPREVNEALWYAVMALNKLAAKRLCDA